MSVWILPKKHAKSASHDIVPVQVVENVHDDDRRQQAEINLAHQSFLSLGALGWGQVGDINRGFFLWVGSGSVGKDLDVIHMEWMSVCPLGIRGILGRHDAGGYLFEVSEEEGGGGRGGGGGERETKSRSSSKKQGR